MDCTLLNKWSLVKLLYDLAPFPKKGVDILVCTYQVNFLSLCSFFFLFTLLILQSLDSFIFLFCFFIFYFIFYFIFLWLPFFFVVPMPFFLVWHPKYKGVSVALLKNTKKGTHKYWVKLEIVLHIKYVSKHNLYSDGPFRELRQMLAKTESNVKFQATGV